MGIAYKNGRKPAFHRQSVLVMLILTFFDQLVQSDTQLEQKSARMMQIKGVAQITAWSLLSELPELGQMNRKEIAKLVGLAPLAKQSGKFNGQRKCQAGKTRLGSKGRFDLRMPQHTRASLSISAIINTFPDFPLCLCGSSHLSHVLLLNAPIALINKAFLILEFP